MAGNRRRRGEHLPGVDGIMRGGEWARQLREHLAGSPLDTASWMDRHTRLLKKDTFSRAGLLDLDQQPCFVKFYQAKSPWQRLGFRLGYGRAMHSFEAATQLRDRGLATPAPRACLLVPEGVLLLTEGIPDGRDLRALWRERPAADLAQQFMRCAGDTLAGLHRAGFAHGDCKWSNLLWGGVHFHLVDLDVARRVGYDARAVPPVRRRQLRDLARFTVDAEELGASQEQYDIFLQSYCAASHCSRAQLTPAIRSAAAPIRRRHAQKSGGAGAPASLTD